MASVRKKNNDYEVTVSDGYDSNGKKVTVSRTFIPEPNWNEKRVQKELEKFKVELENRVKHGDNVKADKITIEKLSADFLADMKPPELSHTTYESYKKIIEQRIIPHIGQERITRVNGHTAKMFEDAVRSEGRLDKRKGPISEQTIKRMTLVLSAMLSYAVSLGWLSMNPLIFSGKQRRKQTKKKEYEVAYLSIEQVKKFLWILDNPVKIRRKAHVSKRGNKAVETKEYYQHWQLDTKWRFFFYLSLFTGDRRGENISLTWDNIDFEKCTVNISKSTAKTEDGVLLKDTKTHASRVTVVPSFVMQVGKELLAEQKRICLSLGDKWQGYRGRSFNKNFVFTSWDGSQMHLDSPRREFKRLIRIYNENVSTSEEDRLPEAATLHSLRHTTASILISNNMDPQSVAGILGHAKSTTTLNIYSYFFKSKNQEAANIMENVLLNPTGKTSIVG